MLLERGGQRHTLDILPYEKDVEAFAPPYTPEKFSEEEKSYLRPFFSNTNKPIFVVQHLPEEVIGALSSRYSRSTQSLRRMFLTEYVWPIIHPDQEVWETLSPLEQQNRASNVGKFSDYIKLLNTGSIDSVVNLHRAQQFFNKWLEEYGDDSIAEMGGVHLCIEGLSNIATKEIEDKRIGISPLEKSSRYVSFAQRRPDGEYQYIVPGEIKNTPLENEYREAMDLLFETYSDISEPYFEYIKERYPQGSDETPGSFRNSRSAKRFDDIRDLLPFSTQTNVALFGNGRAFEDLIDRLMDHPLGEMRWWGQAICNELEKVVPSFVRRPKIERGAKVQVYRSNVQLLREEISKKLFGDFNPLPEQARWTRLLSFTPQPDVEILSAFLFSGKHGLSMSQVRELVGGMTPQERSEQIAKILEERKLGNPEAQRPEVRFRKVPRAFENAHFLFEIWGRGGDYRDLHRHRQLTQERQRFTTKWDYDLEREVLESPFAKQVKFALEKAAEVFCKLEQVSPDVAQYAVPFGFLQHWYMNLSAREIYWMVELRTGPQGRPHYREICQQIAKLALDANPALFQGLMTDWDDYSLARRESERRIDKRLGQLGVIRE